MRTIKTDNSKITIEISNESSSDEIKILVNVEGSPEAISAKIPSTIMKTKFTDAAFFRHIINFLIKD